ncbi:MAG: hypothetical protein JWL64_1675, partial [Frankiales bacterium]|nr:hypothetical protein [Frankiales bacterium]
MPRLTALATHLPAWGTERARVLGADEDALTLAVSAGRAALDAAGSPEVTAVLVVTRDLPVLEGGVEPIVLAGLGLGPEVRLALQVGGPTAALDTLASAQPGTLVIAVDVTPSAAAAAAYVGPDGSEASELAPLARSERSLPMRVRTSAGEAFDYADPRLQRVRGTGSALTRLDLQDKPVAVAGLSTKEAGS